MSTLFVHNFLCMQCRDRPMVGNYYMQLGSRWVSVNTFWPGSTIWHPMIPACWGRPGYCREPHWNSIGAPGNFQGNAAGMVTFVIFGAGNGFSPPRYQAITQNNDMWVLWYLSTLAIDGIPVLTTTCYTPFVVIALNLYRQAGTRK